MRTTCSLALLLLAAAPAAGQTVLAEWTFNSPVPDADPTTGSLAPSTLAPGIDASLVMRGGVTPSFVGAAGLTGGSESGPDNSVLRLTGFPQQGQHNWTAGLQVVFSMPQDLHQYITVRYRLACSPGASCVHSAGLWPSADPNLLEGLTNQYSGPTLRNNDFFEFFNTPAHISLPPNTPTAMSQTIFSEFRAPGAYGALVPGPSYNPDAPWYVDRITVLATPNVPPVPFDRHLLVNAGTGTTWLLMDGSDPNGGNDKLSAGGGGDPQFNRPYPGDAQRREVTFDAPATVAAPTDYHYSFTLTDYFSASASGLITVTVLPSSIESVTPSFAVTPALLHVPCEGAWPDQHARGLLTASAPPGDGEVEYHWFWYNPPNWPEGSDHWEFLQGGLGPQWAVLHPPASNGRFICGARRLGGGPWLWSNLAEVSLISADIGVSGGLPGRDGILNNNDFIAFIDAFFDHNLTADYGSRGGEYGGDGQLDNNDFVVFIDVYFGGC